MTDNQIEAVALQPCPFCGGKAELVSTDDGYIVECLGGRRCIAQVGPHGWEVYAVEAWNRRRPVAAKRAALREQQEQAEPHVASRCRNAQCDSQPEQAGMCWYCPECYEAERQKAAPQPGPDVPSWTREQIRHELQNNCDAWIDWDDETNLPRMPTIYDANGENCVHIDGTLNGKQMAMLVQLTGGKTDPDVLRLVRTQAERWSQQTMSMHIDRSSCEATRMCGQQILALLDKEPTNV